MKALSLRSRAPDRQGPGIILGAPFQFSLKSILSRKSGCGTPMMMPDLVKQAKAWTFICGIVCFCTATIFKFIFSKLKIQVLYEKFQLTSMFSLDIF